MTLSFAKKVGFEIESKVKLELLKQLLVQILFWGDEEGEERKRKKVGDNGFKFSALSLFGLANYDVIQPLYRLGNRKDGSHQVSLI